MQLSTDASVQTIIDLDEISNAYFAIHGKNLPNISHWDASSLFYKEISKTIKIPHSGSRFEYEFPYTLPNDLIKLVGQKIGSHEIQLIRITPSGTSANLMALVSFKELRKKRIIIVGPCYFQIPAIAKELGFQVEHINAWTPLSGLSDHDFGLIKRDEDVIWITNPAYCFGIYYNKTEYDTISKMLSDGYSLMFDECNCINGRELCRTFGNFPNFYGTYAPHKGCCINGVKFGVFLTSQLGDMRLDYLSDTWIGPLPRSIRSDMSHFTSKNFDSIKSIFLQYTEHSSQEIHNVATSLPVKFYQGIGHLRVISFNEISSDLELSKGFLNLVISKSQATFIPMRLNYNPKDMDFAFRINVLGRKSILIRSLLRLTSNIVSFKDVI